MGNCFSFKLFFCQTSKKKVVLLLLGLESAGKTTVAKGLARELENGVVPTVGFSSVSLTYKKFTVILYDLGGGPEIRAIWENYFADVHGIIFVVDSADISKLAECREILMSVLSSDKLSGKPLLVLGNKQDVPGALDEIDIVEMLDLENLVNQQKCPTLLETCTAITLEKSHPKEDPAIQNSFKWLLSLIERDFEQLNSRVEQDMALQREIDQAALKAKLQRIAENQKSDSIQQIPELENGEIENANETEKLEDISANLIVSSGSLIDTELVDDSKRLDKQTTVSGSNHECSNCGRGMLNWFCVCPSSSRVSKLTKSPRKNCISSERRFCFGRSRRTVPLNLETKEEGNGDAGGENIVPVWAVRLPSSQSVGISQEADASISVPPLFTVPSQPENTIELEELTGVRHPSRPGPFQVMKG